VFSWHLAIYHSTDQLPYKIYMYDAFVYLFYSFVSFLKQTQYTQWWNKDTAGQHSRQERELIAARKQSRTGTEPLKPATSRHRRRRGVGVIRVPHWCGVWGAPKKILKCHRWKSYILVHFHALLGRPTYLSADLVFIAIPSFFHSSFFFRDLPSKLAEPNSTISGHMVWSKYNLKMHV